MDKLVLVYTQEMSPRLDYVLSFMFEDIIGCAVDITTDRDSFVLAPAAKICYAPEPVEGALHIIPSGLLHHYELIKQKVEAGSLEDMPTLFPSPTDAAFPFDIFAATFFLITRYEEYLPFLPDIHGRFEAYNSLAAEHSFLRRPIVDEWALYLRDELKKRFPHLSFTKRSFRYMSTIDVDNAYAFLYKGMVRTLGATFRSMMRMDVKDNWDRVKTLKGEDDPFDTYDYFHELHEKYDVKPTWFFLLGEYGKYDKGVSRNREALKELIEDIAARHEVGIHPSYGSNKNMLKLKEEVEFLKQLIGRDVCKSRQHYLKLLFTETYRNLIELGICEDYTMGYSTDIGFRAGTCTPFYFYDLYRETQTTLKIIPFQVMDVTLNQYLNLTMEEAEQMIYQLVDRVREVDGTFVSLWHNESLSDHGYWKGWKPLYQKMLKYIFEG
ncbi:MAG: polysaccharide deacetylase family protein [Bacteroidota bacterium]